MMKGKPSAPFVLSAEQIEFALGNVVIYAGSTDRDSNAHLTHAYGCAIDNNGALRVFVDLAHAEAVIADIRDNGNIAVAFAQPGTERALQLKAVQAKIINVTDEDMELVARYYDRIVAHIHPFGFSEPMLRAFFAPPKALVALRFKPHIAFDQTPGPNAGAEIKARAC